MSKRIIKKSNPHSNFGIDKKSTPHSFENINTNHVTQKDYVEFSFKYFCDKNDFFSLKDLKGEFFISFLQTISSYSSMSLLDFVGNNFDTDYHPVDFSKSCLQKHTIQEKLEQIGGIGSIVDLEDSVYTCKIHGVVHQKRIVLLRQVSVDTQKSKTIFYILHIDQFHNASPSQKKDGKYYNKTKKDKIGLNELEHNVKKIKCKTKDCPVKNIYNDNEQENKHITVADYETLKTIQASYPNKTLEDCLNLVNDILCLEKQELEEYIEVWKTS